MSRRTLIARWRLVVAAATVVVVVLGDSYVRAQDGSGRWLLGSWEGAREAPGILDDKTRFDFTKEQGGIRWQMLRKTRAESWQAELHGSGRVSSASESAVELDGKYDSGRLAGRALKYSFKRNGDMLEGYGLGTQNTTLGVSLKRAK